MAQIKIISSHSTTRNFRIIACGGKVRQFNPVEFDGIVGFESNGSDLRVGSLLPQGEGRDEGKENGDFLTTPEVTGEVTREVTGEVAPQVYLLMAAGRRFLEGGGK